MKFPYHEIPRNPTLAFPDHNSRLVPIVPILLKNGDKEFEIDALVDSGASSCLFAGMLGLGLGLDVKRGPSQPIYGIGSGNVIAYYHNITLQIGNVVWQEYVGFCFDNFRIDGILGQKGFFNNFKVNLDYQAKCVMVHRRNMFQKVLTQIGI